VKKEKKVGVEEQPSNLKDPKERKKMALEEEVLQLRQLRKVASYQEET
jgi:hypothetical protein